MEYLDARSAIFLQLCGYFIAARGIVTFVLGQGASARVYDKDRAHFILGKILGF